MAIAYEGTPDDVIAVAMDGYGLQGELEGYLRSWMSLRDDFAVFVSASATARAIQDTMDAAHQSGSKLAKSMQDILDLLKDTGVKVDSMDLESAAQLHYDGVTSGLGTGPAGTTIETGTNGSVDTQSW